MNKQATPNSPDAATTLPPQMIKIWWLLLGLLLLWNVFGFFFHVSGPSVVTLPYSVFINQVKQDNVSQVSLAGGKIDGSFKQPVLWPSAAGKVKTSGSATPATSVTVEANSPTPEGKPSSNSVHAKSTTPLQTPPAGWPALAVTNINPAKYEAFMTTFPEAVGDPGLLTLLESHGVEFAATEPHNPWLAKALLNILPFALLMGFFWWMGRRAAKQQSSIFGLRNGTAKRFDSQRASESFKDVAGADAAKQQLQEEVDFLRYPEKYSSVGATLPRGVLLAGPPGTGKTLLARAVAGEAGVPFFSVSGSDFVEMFVGIGASRIRDVFKQAKETAPAILFIDELDAVGRRRGAGFGAVNDEREQTLNQLLVEMDGFDAREQVIVIAATNRPDVLDPALLRAGRFDRNVVVDLPDARGREGILRIHSQHLRLSDDVSLAVLASVTIGMSGAQLANLCNEAALIAARDKSQIVRHADFESALDKLILGDVRPLVLDEHTRRVIAYHEGGHALVAWLIPGADIVHKVTIVPHGQALGVTEQRPGADQYNFTKSYLLARIAVLLGGRVAEELVMQDITTGAENDLIEATRLARKMVTAWGMSDLGLTAYQEAPGDRFLGAEAGERRYSESTASKIDQLVQSLLEERQRTVSELLTRERDRLDRLADYLLANEVIDQTQLQALLGPRPPSPTDITGTRDNLRKDSQIAAYKTIVSCAVIPQTDASCQQPRS